MGERGRCEGGTAVKEAFLVFWVEERRFALPVGDVVRVVAAAETTALPDGPEFLCGVLNVAGEAVPVFDPRPRLGGVRRDMALDDRFVVLRQGPRSTALWVDAVEGVLSLDVQEIALRASDEVFSVATRKEDGGVVLIRSAHALLAFVTARAGEPHG